MSKYGAFLLLCFGTYLISEVSGIKDPGYRGKPWYGKNKLKEATMIKKPVKDIGPPPGHPNYVAKPFRIYLPRMAESRPERYLSLYDTYYPNDEAGIYEKLKLRKLNPHTGRLTRDSKSADVESEEEEDDDPGHQPEDEEEDDDVEVTLPPEVEAAEVEEEENWRAKKRRMEKWRQEYLARRYSEHRQNLRNKFAGWAKHQGG